MDRPLISALKVAFLYALFATGWILFSDSLVNALLSDEQLRALAQTYKGLAFVVITSALLLLLVHRTNQELEKANDMDSLTGLVSLNMFRRNLESTIRKIKPGEQIILGYLDIDNFKAINDSIGYDKADNFLRDLAQDISETALPGSVVARMHADQFGSFSIIDDSVDMEAHVFDFQRLFANRAKQHGLDATCSIGVALYPADGSSAKEIMVSATEAMNVAKKKKNAIQFHDKALTEKALQRRQMVIELRQAIEDNELSVVYQPKYNLKTMTASGVEVLVRWHHPEKGFIPPDVFIPLAEDNGLTSAISKLVVNKVARELGSQSVLGYQLQHISVNVSATEFNNAKEMHELTQLIKNETPLAPFMRIEITETATLSDMKKSLSIIANLQADGLTFSVDDFGTGYTSLAMLKDLTVDEIKIDRSFVSGLEHDDRARTIVSAIIAMAHSFEINVVAEGVETQQQLDILEQLECQEAQGYFLGRPMPIDEFVDHLKTDNKTRTGETTSQVLTQSPTDDHRQRL